MDFCDNCFNYLFTKEIINNNEKKIIYYCKKCNFQKDSNNFVIFKKTYKTNINKKLDTIESNKIKVLDDTLPNIKVKCNHCKQSNNNKYEIKYYNNSYWKEIICINCYKII